MLKINIRFTEKDIKLMTYLKRYKMMSARECRKIYKVKEYHYKRLKVLEKERYIKRVDKFYIKLDIKGINLMKDIGYDYKNVCRKARYQERIKDIVRIAAITLDSQIEFIPSWELKDEYILTETRKKIYWGVKIFK